MEPQLPRWQLMAPTAKMARKQRRQASTTAAGPCTIKKLACCPARLARADPRRLPSCSAARTRSNLWRHPWRQLLLAQLPKETCRRSISLSSRWRLSPIRSSTAAMRAGYGRPAPTGLCHTARGAGSGGSWSGGGARRWRTRSLPALRDARIRRNRSGRKKLARIDRLLAAPQLKIELRLVDVAGRADPGDHRAAMDLFALFDEQLVAMPVGPDPAIGGLVPDPVAVAARPRSR